MAKSKKAKPKATLLPDKPIIILMIAGFVVGFILYTVLYQSEAPLDISITHIEFFPGDGIITLNVRTLEFLPALCDVIIDIDTKNGETVKLTEHLGVIEMDSNDSTTSIVRVLHTTLPEGPFEYELALDCESFEYGWNLE